MYSDDTVNFPAYRAAKLIADKSNAPVYFYHFTYQGRYSSRYEADETTPLGTKYFINYYYYI